jgi:hypothetical protein
MTAGFHPLEPWQCEGCKGWFPADHGCADDWPDLCDDCWCTAARITGGAGTTTMEGMMGRKTCEMCAHWVREPANMDGPRKVGYCRAGGGTRHEAASCPDGWEALAEAETDPAPDSGENDG